MIMIETLWIDTYTSWVEDKYEKRQEDEEEKSSHRCQKVHNVCVVLVEEQFAHLELNIRLLLIIDEQLDKFKTWTTILTALERAQSPRGNIRSLNQYHLLVANSLKMILASCWYHLIFLLFRYLILQVDASFELWRRLYILQPQCSLQLDQHMASTFLTMHFCRNLSWLSWHDSFKSVWSSALPNLFSLGFQLSHLDF